MLTRALFLSTGWLVLSFIATLLRGTKVRHGNKLRSLLWQITLLLCGDLWAVLTFGIPIEIAGLTIIAFVLGVIFIWLLPYWNSLGQTLFLMSILTSILYVAYSFGVTAFTPLNPLAFLIAFGLTCIETLALGLALSYAYESLDVCCRIHWTRQFLPLAPIPGYMPKVSLHVPAYNEPAKVVEATLRSLAQLNYPNYEVLVIDNNTPDEQNWRALEKVCDDLGPRFRFLHLDKWPGYKSGALNFALTQTAPDAEIISIIDADYRVSPDFLSVLTPYFSHPTVAFVQTPQDYRDYQGNPYLEACHYGYKYFFAVSMPSRNEHNAIIFAGTMGLIRRSVLQEIGGWDEWCITEDAEASLRVLKRGYQSVFVNQAYGTGLMPYTFDGLKRQRFRWCFGGIQILKKHWESLMPWAHWLDPDNHLTMAQRYYYLVGGLQWFNEPLNLVFTIFLILGALLHLSPAGGIIRPLTGPLIVIPAIFLIVGIWRFLWVLRYTLNLSYRDAIRAMGNFFSLGWTVTLACIQGLIQSAGVFMRTPKSRSTSGVVRALFATQWETTIGLLCVLLAVLVNLVRPQPATIFLGGLLTWQASLYLVAPYYSLSSIRGQELKPIDMPGPAVQENRIARWAVAIVLGLLLGVGVSQLLPTPTQTPGYARLQPVEVPPQRLVGLPPPPPTLEIPSPTATLTGTATSTPTVTGTLPTLTPSATQDMSLTATNTPDATATTPSTPTTSPTPNVTSTPTASSTPLPSQTPSPTQTLSPTPVPTNTPSPTLLPSNTSSPTLTPTWTPSSAAASGGSGVGTMGAP